MERPVITNIQQEEIQRQKKVMTGLNAISAVNEYENYFKKRKS